MNCGVCWTRLTRREVVMREYFDPNWTEYAFGALFTVAWQAGVLVAVAQLGSLIARRAPVRAAIWSACTVGLSLTPVASLFLPHCFVAYMGLTEPLHFPTHIVRLGTPGVAGSGFWTIAERNWADGVCLALLFVWVAGVGFSLARMAWG